MNAVQMLFPFITNKCLIICNVIYYYALTLIREERERGRRVKARVMDRLEAAAVKPCSWPAPALLTS